MKTLLFNKFSLGRFKMKSTFMVIVRDLKSNSLKMIEIHNHDIDCYRSYVLDDIYFSLL